MPKMRPKIHLEQLNYYPDLAPWAASIAAQNWSIFLDSCPASACAGRYSILSCEPDTTLTTAANTLSGTTTYIQTAAGATTTSSDCPFALIKQQLIQLENPSPLPFNGGALGYFAYDLNKLLARVPRRNKEPALLPDMAIGIYTWALISDHHLQKTWFVTVGKNKSHPSWLRWAQQQPPITKLAHARMGPVKASMSAAEYHAHLNTIQEHILAGDVYQINFAQRFECPTSGDPWDIYQQLRTANPAPFAAYMRLNNSSILSLSPERFLQVNSSGLVTTQPIKGTRPRSSEPEEDARLAAELQHSEKDRAENVMIVDLMRNDLAKNCIAGSVKVPALFEIETFPAVHHLVSTVTGKLLPDRDALDVLRACFPGGSISGAPKLRAMQIIENLESHLRGVYCGAIGLISNCGNLDTNIAIRTLVHQNNSLTFWAGGGIVADSVSDLEYKECFDKISLFLKTFALSRCYNEEEPCSLP